MNRPGFLCLVLSAMSTLLGMNTSETAKYLDTLPKLREERQQVPQNTEQQRIHCYLGACYRQIVYSSSTQYVCISNGYGKELNIEAYSNGQQKGSTPYHRVEGDGLKSLHNEKQWYALFKQDPKWHNICDEVKIFDILNKKLWCVKNKSTKFFDATLTDKFLLACGSVPINNASSQTSVYQIEDGNQKELYNIKGYDWPCFNLVIKNLLGLALAMPGRTEQKDNVAVWDVDTNKKIVSACLPNESGQSFYPTWSTDGQKFFVCDSSYSQFICYLWMKDQKLHTISYAENPVIDLNPSKIEGKLMVLSTLDNARILNTADDTFQGDIAQKKIITAAINPTDPNMIATIAENESAITLWDAKGNKINAYAVYGCPFDIAWKPDGSALALTRVTLTFPSMAWQTLFISKKELLEKNTNKNNCTIS